MVSGESRHSHSNHVRLLIEPEPNPGPWNMAVDEVLLEAALQRGAAAVRWYRWDEATVSLGYFQRASLIAAGDMERLPMVRRLTGGGAILHHHELTYSCAVPAGHPLAREPLRLYEEVHAAIIGVLARRGVVASLRGCPASACEGTGTGSRPMSETLAKTPCVSVPVPCPSHDRKGRAEPFLCFGRGDPRDVLFAGRKILGSAQRRRRGAVLQHGSLLLEASPFAPDFPGLNDLAGRRVLGPEDVDDLATAVAATIGATVQPGPLDSTDQRRAAELCEERYRYLDWQRRSNATSGGVIGSEAGTPTSTARPFRGNLGLA